MAKTRNKLQEMQEELDRLKQKRTILDRKIADQEEKIQTMKTEEIMEVVSSVNVTPGQLKEILKAHFENQPETLNLPKGHQNMEKDGYDEETN